VSIHSALVEVIFKFTRPRRMRRFAAATALTDQTRVLDVGGTCVNWKFIPQRPHVVLLNLDTSHADIGTSEQFEFVEGDARSLSYPDGAFDVLFSNSLIEHLGTRNDQQAFATEVRRVGRRIWIQTPAKVFPIEPHYLTPFVHWLPKGLRKKLLRNFSVWGWLTRPSQEKVEAFVNEIRLLTHSEMQEFFPDCEIHTERFLLWPKAYVAVRRN
jgi:hypothetical protein